MARFLVRRTDNTTTTQIRQLMNLTAVAAAVALAVW